MRIIMKKRVLTLALMTAASLFASDTLRSEMAVTLGYNKFDDASKMENATLFGLRGTVYENEVNKYGLQLGYEGSYGVAYEKMGKETDVHRFYANMVVDGEEEYNVTPYLFLGGGYELLSDEIKGEPSQGFVDLGLGFKYYLNNMFNLLFEMRALGKFDTRDLGLSATVGLGYMYGGKHQKMVAPIVALDTPKIETTSVKEPPVAATKINIVRLSSPQMGENESTIAASEVNEDVAPLEEVVFLEDQVAKKPASPKTGYYVQMAALEKTSALPLIDRIKRGGYENVVTESKGVMTLVLVGPYEDGKLARLAQRALKSIRDDAFIKRVQ